MAEQLSKYQNKPRILISGALPPPMGGVGAYYQTLLNSSLPAQVNLNFVQTSSQKRELSNTGKATFSNFVAAIIDCWHFTKAVLSTHPQIAHIGTSLGLSYVKHTYCVFFARLLGCRVLIHPHCSLSALYNERSKLWQWYVRQVIGMTNGVVVLSKEWLQLSSIVHGCKVYYLPNAINLKLYRSVAEKHLMEVDKDGPCKILYLGWIGKAKGSFDILDAAVEANSQGMNIIFDIVGDEVAHGELELLEQKIKSSTMEDYVRLHPFASGETKLNFLKYADIFAYPSYHEGMPMAVIEAMASALPIVATSVGGIPDLVKEGVNGLLVEPGQPHQLVLAFHKLANNYRLCQSMKKMSYQFACERYDIEQHVVQLISIYQSVLL